MIQILKTIIKDFHTRPLPSFSPRQLDVPSDIGKIITIIGPRRAGKTWYFFQLMAQLEDRGVKRQQLLYLNFEDERLDLHGNYDQILAAYLELYPEQCLGELYIFFDEIQELPDWEKYVRRMYDTVSHKIFLTGSNAKMLSQEIATSLRGRSLSFEIMPLSFAEFLQFRGVDSQERYSTRNRAKIQQAYDDYLLWGGYPELVSMDNRFKASVLQEYFSVMLYRDLIERYEIRDTAILKYLIKRLIASFTKEFSVNKLYNDLKSRGFKIGKDSIYQLIEHILSVYMVASVEKYDPAVVRREMSNRKVYLYDNGFASITQYAFFEDRGKLFENLVFVQLRRQGHEIYFLKNGYECDFVVLKPGEPPVLIQVADVLHRDNLERELKGLEKGRKGIQNGRGVLLVNEIAVSQDLIPAWIEVELAADWLLK
ncbi:MAG: ATP-binding protein [Thermodesulfobacteriota bacterium]|nr:ATP-binding protein [Thermodesulfobacteriota bacterium]